VNSDGYADIITGASAGNPDVRVFSGKDIAYGTFNPTGASLLAQWFAYPLGNNVGANVAAGDVNGDGYADIVTGATSGNPDVFIYNGRDIPAGTFNPYGVSRLTRFFAYGVATNLGAFVAVADTTDSGYADIITGATSGNPNVRVFNGQAIAQGTFPSMNPRAGERTEFFAYPLGTNIGVTVGGLDLEGTGQFDLLTGSTSAPTYRVVKGNAGGIFPAAVLENTPKDLQGGISVGA
jgi:fibronectin-binding autotransporter adhesin